MRVRIGVSQATKELDIDVEDSKDVLKAFEEADAAGERIFWVTETDGRRHGIVVASVLYFELEAQESGKIGFGIG